MSDEAVPPNAGRRRGGRRAVSERGACGGAAGEAPTASPAEGGEGPLGIDELAERSEAFQSEQAVPPNAGPQRAGRRAVSERGACGSAAVDELAERSDAFP